MSLEFSWRTEQNGSELTHSKMLYLGGGSHVLEQSLYLPAKIHGNYIQINFAHDLKFSEVFKWMTMVKYSYVDRFFCSP